MLNNEVKGITVTADYTMIQSSRVLRFFNYTFRQNDTRLSKNKNNNI